MRLVIVPFMFSKYLARPGRYMFQSLSVLSTDLSWLVLLVWLRLNTRANSNT